MYCRSADPFKYEHGPYDVVIVPVLSDNYSYLICDRASGTAAAVDPAEADKVIAAAETAGVRIAQVLTTHKHYDHAGGNKALKQAVADVEIVGSAIDNVEACTRPVADGDVLELGALRITCMVTPGHTRGSLCFHIQADGDAGSVFTGDTLFVGGCGRLFEGEAEDMWPAIEQRLAPLPPETRVYVGHEYTIKNLEFAVTVDKDSERRACSWISQNR